MKNYYKCEVCGNTMSLDTSMVLTSCPPKYECWCDNCNHVDYIDCSDRNKYNWKRIKENYFEKISAGDKANIIKTGQLTINGPKTFLENADLSCLHIDTEIVGNPAIMTIRDDEQFLSIDQQIDIYEKALANLKEQKKAEKWKFTEDEKAILRNLPKKYKWIARCNVCQILSVFEDKPFKDDDYWKEKKSYGNGPVLVFGITGMNLFSHLFQCIQWEDDEPCEFRKFI